MERHPSTLARDTESRPASQVVTNPTNIEFAADGRVFVAEKRGVIKVWDSVTDPTPTVFADSNLQSNVHNFWDRGCSVWPSIRA